MNATNAILLWNPLSGAVLLKPWPEADRLHQGYQSGLACYAAVRRSNFEQRKTTVLIEAIHLVVRDGIDPQKLHAVLLGLDEYRDACSDDMPGMDGRCNE